MQRTCTDAQFHRVRQKTWEGSGDNPVSQYPPTREISLINDIKILFILNCYVVLKMKK